MALLNFEVGKTLKFKILLMLSRYLLGSYFDTRGQVVLSHHTCRVVIVILAPV